jgi:hypothetical protein
MEEIIEMREEEIMTVVEVIVEVTVVEVLEGEEEDVEEETFLLDETIIQDTPPTLLQLPLKIPTENLTETTTIPFSLEIFLLSPLQEMLKTCFKENIR